MEILNRSVNHEYHVDDILECGICLRGNEVKSIRVGSCNIRDSWVSVQDGNLVLRGMHILAWGTSNVFDVDEKRERRLLAHRSEIRKLEYSIKKDGVTLIPIKVYFTDRGRCKVQVGICRGKRNYDKRQSLKDSQMKREIARELKLENKRG